ncbi:DNA cytosine methyltransferase [Streptomyces sp. MnatMP-M27]|uniref:DNA cytosine methyltransferase n=1 Tax=Streptomyces sp. MnatMP-M27 TaxID=1839768 RepID=UPI00210ED283|nr:DNA (cytosine-5-)-methyltransferase [Streptomyces sp. MnatMP-M27]
MTPPRLSSLEICAGAGGQALGLERAGFDPVMLIENDENSCKTLKLNRPSWDVLRADVIDFDPEEHPYVYDVDLLAGGLPRVKSAATIQRRESDNERKLLEAAVWLTHSVQPRAVLLENVPDLVTSGRFQNIRSWIVENLADVGYDVQWRVLDAADFGVAQHRRQGFLVAMRDPEFSRFEWPEPSAEPAPTVGEVLEASMSRAGWPGASSWVRRANEPAPAIVGGSPFRGGADLGPTGSKRAWARLGVNGNSIGDAVPGPDFPADALPKLNVRQVAALQSFPDEWRFFGRKTSVYRQVGHASPPLVAEAVGRRIAHALGVKSQAGSS